MTIAALVVSLVSIAIAYHHGHVMEELVHQNERLVTANSLPYLQIGFTTNLPDGERSPALVAINAGTGPAVVRNVSMFLDGRPVATLGQLMQDCCGISAHFGGATLTQRMVRPGEVVRFAELPPKAPRSDSDRFVDAIKNRLSVSACYCSVFDECWQSEARPGGQIAPTKVTHCARGETYRD